MVHNNKISRISVQYIFICVFFFFATSTFYCHNIHNYNLELDHEFLELNQIGDQ